MTESRWLKSWLDVNESYYRGIGMDISANIYNQDEGVVGHDEERE